jgi:hypothetical protein
MTKGCVAKKPLRNLKKKPFNKYPLNRTYVKGQKQKWKKATINTTVWFEE